MSKVIKYVATIEEQTGRVMNVEFPQATIKPEGTTNGLTIVHVTEELVPEGFMTQGTSIMEFIWTGSKFRNVGKPPNRFAIYNGTEWTWDAELLLNDVRAARNAKLASSDWTQLPDAQLSEEEKLAWQIYRQELRDIIGSVDGITSVNDVSWPTKP